MINISNCANCNFANTNISGQYLICLQIDDTISNIASCLRYRAPEIMCWDEYNKPGIDFNPMIENEFSIELISGQQLAY